jgi:hypothetical protein
VATFKVGDIGDYVMLLVCWAAAIYGIANAVYALLFPARFLRARWTTTRGLPPTTPSKDVLPFGIVLALVAGGFTWVAYGMTSKILGR